MIATPQETPTSTDQPSIVGPNALFSLAGKWNAELIEFYLGLMQQYSLIPFRVFDLHSVESFMKAQKDIYEEFAEECQAEAEKLASLTTEEPDEPATAPETSYEAQIIRAQEDARQIIALAREQADRIIADAEKVAAGRRAAAGGSHAEGDSAAA